MHSKATLAISNNVKRLMEHHGGMSQRELAKAAGISQSAIGFLLRYRDDADRHPTTSTVEAVARVFGLEAWQLMIPNQPLEALLNKQLEKHTMDYLQVGDSGRAAVDRATAVEVRIAGSEAMTTNGTSRKAG